MSEYQKAFLKGLIWTTIEAFVGSAGACKAFSEINWDVVGFAVLIADLIFVGKTIGFGIPAFEPAKEIKEEDVGFQPVKEYEDTENYDDLYVDDTLDDEDGDSDEVE